MLAVVRVIDRTLFKTLGVLGCLMIAALATVCLYQVFSRFVLAAPTVWSESLARTLMIWGVFIGMPVALRRGAAITMSVLAEMAPPRLKTIIDTIVFIGIAFALAVVLWQGIALLGRISNQRLAGLDIPIVWAYAAIPVGAALGLCALVLNWIDQFRKDRPSTPAFEGETP